MNLVLMNLLLSLTFASTFADDIQTLVYLQSDTDVRRLERFAEEHSGKALPVFSRSEREALESFDLKRLAFSYRVTFEKNREDSVDTLRKQFPNWKVESNHIDFQLNSYEGKQWGLKNTGESQPIVYGYLNWYETKGKAGEDIDLPDPVAPKGASKLVAVLDTGADSGHPDLKDVLYAKGNECRNLLKYIKCLEESKSEEKKKSCESQWGNVDTDGNGYPLDCLGWNVSTDKLTPSGVMGDWDTSDYEGHGTHIAGIIAASNDEEGISGVSDQIKILPVKILGKESLQLGGSSSINQQLPGPSEERLKWTRRGLSDVVARGLLYAIRSNVDVINMSFGWMEAAGSELIDEMIALAHRRGIVLVAAATNDSAEWDRAMPCHYAEVICVASHDADGTISHFSNYGFGVDLAAPGGNILSAWTLKKRAEFFTAEPGYEYVSGTSQAVPYVVGAAAVLLMNGVPASEVKPRLLLGARPHRLSKTRKMEKKYTRSGNLSISRALSLKEQPMFLPVNKKATEIFWDRKTRSLDVSVQIRNEWAAASKGQIKFSVAQGFGVQLEEREYSFQSWLPGEVKTINLRFGIERLDFGSQILLQGEVALDPEAEKKQVVFVPIEVMTIVSERLGDVDVYSLKESIGSEWEILNVQTLSKEMNTLEYIGALPGARGVRYRKWELRNGVLEENAETFFDFKRDRRLKKSQLRVTYRVDIDLDSVPDYVFIYVVPGGPGKRAEFLFSVYDEKFNLKRKFTYDNEYSNLSDRFQWMKLKSAEGEKLVPAWFGLGQVPPSERKPYNPWDPDPHYPVEPRYFYLDGDTLHTVKLPDEFYPLPLLNPSDDQKNKGVVPTLLAKGEGAWNRFFYAEITDGKVDGVQEVSQEVYQNIAEMTGVKPLEGDTDGGNALFRQIGDHAADIAILERASSVDRWTSQGYGIEPLNLYDSIVNMISGFQNTINDGHSAFFQTLYDYQFHDFKTGEVAYRSMNRFSFLRTSFSYRHLAYSATVKFMDERIPAIYEPLHLASLRDSALIIPRYVDGELQEKLVSPAYFRMRTPSHCRSLRNLVELRGEGFMRAVYLCKDKLISVPLEIKDQ